MKPAFPAQPHSRAVLFPLRDLVPPLFLASSLTALLFWAKAWSFSPVRKHLLVGVKVTRRTLGITSRTPAVLLARGVWGMGRAPSLET